MTTAALIETHALDLARRVVEARDAGRDDSELMRAYRDAVRALRRLQHDRID